MFPTEGTWRLVPEFSDEFEAADDGRYIMLPVNTTKWATNVTSWGNWTWEPENVKIVANVSGMSKATVEGTTGSYAALTMTYEEHQRKPNGPTYFYKSAIMKSTLPAGIVYGRFEARIKGASVWPGVCPAFWAWRNGGNYWTELVLLALNTRVMHTVENTLPSRMLRLQHTRSPFTLAGLCGND